MLTESEQKHVEILHREYGDQPLIQLVRRLIVKIDNSEKDSRARKNIILSLKILTGERNLGEDSSRWLDWLESQSELTLKWDDVISSTSTPPATPTTIKNDSPPKRKLVVAEAEPRPKDLDMPLSKEQAIWNKALKRSEKGQKPKSKLVMALVAVLIVGAVGYLGFLVKDRLSLSDIISPDVATTSPVNNSWKLKAPQALWGNYTFSGAYPSPWMPKSSNSTFIDYLQQEEMMPALASESQKLNPQRKLHKNNVLWMDLWSREHQYMEDLFQMPEELNFSSIKSQKNKWQWTRFNRHGDIVSSGTFTETVQNKKNHLDISIKRMVEKDGLAHRFILGKKGLISWSWRIRYQGGTIDGKVGRSKSGDEMICRYRGVNWSRITQKKKIDQGWVLLPAVWTPVLSRLKQGSVFLPHVAEITGRVDFFEELEMRNEEKGTFDLVDRDEKWTETWSAILDESMALSQN